MKFSIIVPVYNVEKYIYKCLKSILNQTYENYEIIVVNDGTKDKSQEIIDGFAKKDKRVKSYIKENGGLSDARNYGVEKASGDYILFVDSDDTINKDLLKELNLIIDDQDIIRYNMNKIIDKKEFCDNIEPFSNIQGVESFKKLVKSDLFVTACSSCYKLEYWKKNKFMFAKGRYHEDFGLIPLVYIKAKKVSCINYIGYNYFIRDNSIMTSLDEKSIIKKNEDTLYHYDYLMNEIDKFDIEEYDKKYFKSFLSNSLINRCDILNKKILKDYLFELKERNVGLNLIDDTLIRKIKKLAFNKMPNLYIKFYVKK